MNNPSALALPDKIKQDEEFVCLTDLFRLSKEPRSKRPAHWLRADGVQAEIATISASIGKAAITMRPGRNGGSWAHWRVALRYASWLSPDFRTQCETRLRHLMQAAPMVPPVPALPTQVPANVLPTVERLLSRLVSVQRISTTVADNYLISLLNPLLPMPIPVEDAKVLTLAAPADSVVTPHIIKDPGNQYIWAKEIVETAAAQGMKIGTALVGAIARGLHLRPLHDTEMHLYAAQFAEYGIAEMNKSPGGHITYRWKYSRKCVEPILEEIRKYQAKSAANEKLPRNARLSEAAVLEAFLKELSARGSSE